MREPVRYLTEHATRPISVIPNAGLPLNTGTGDAVYPLEPAPLATALAGFVRDFGVRIVGGYSPPHRPLTPEEREAVIKEINSSRADVVWVGIGVPKQEKWMADMRPELEAPVLLGVGAAFDFHAGLVSQAPNWIQESGLEWAYRLAHEPRRLWRRYLRYNPRFIGAFARQLVAHRRAPHAS